MGNGVTAKSPAALLRTMLGVVLLSAGVVFLLTRLLSFAATDTVAQTDLAQLYAMGRALREGRSPYTPVPELTREFLGIEAFDRNPHPSPYPPSAAMLFVPLSMPDIRVLSIGWLLLSGLAGYYAITLTLGRGTTLFTRAAATGALIITASGASDLTHLQFGFLFLLCYAAAWRLLNAGHESKGGALLALPLIVKGFGWPFLVLLLLHRRIRALVSCLVMTLAGALLPVLLTGSGIWATYFKDALPQATEYWRDSFQNLSLSALPLRLTQHPAVFTLADGGFAHVHVAGRGSSASGYLLSFVVLAVLAFQAYKAREDRAFAAFLVLAPLLGPVSWNHYFVVFGLPIMLLIRSASSKEGVTSVLPAALLILLMLVDFSGLAFRLLCSGLPRETTSDVSLPAVLFASLPTIIATACSFWIVAGSSAAAEPSPRKRN